MARTLQFCALSCPFRRCSTAAQLRGTSHLRSRLPRGGLSPRHRQHSQGEAGSIFMPLPDPHRNKATPRNSNG